ncbi:unnamed protein product, partial [Amoebophrya sp. A25]
SILQNSSSGLLRQRLSSPLLDGHKRPLKTDQQAAATTSAESPSVTETLEARCSSPNVQPRGFFSSGGGGAGNPTTNNTKQRSWLSVRLVPHPTPSSSPQIEAKTLHKSPASPPSNLQATVAAAGMLGSVSSSFSLAQKMIKTIPATSILMATESRSDYDQGQSRGTLKIGSRPEVEDVATGSNGALLCFDGLEKLQAQTSTSSYVAPPKPQLGLSLSSSDERQEKQNGDATLESQIPMRSESIIVRISTPEMQAEFKPHAKHGSLDVKALTA